jgi:hypothetical protein
MNEETLYRKVGRRYVAVAEHDPAFYDGVAYGTHMVTVKHGQRTTWFNVEPDNAAVLAVLCEHEGVLLDALRKATDARVARCVPTEKEQKAYAAWKAVMGDESMALTRQSAADVLRALREAVVGATSRLTSERDA